MLLVGVQEIILASGALGRIGAVIDIHSPLGRFIRNCIDLIDIGRRDAVVHDDVVVPERSNFRNEAL